MRPSTLAHTCVSGAPAYWLQVQELSYPALFGTMPGNRRWPERNRALRGA